MNLPANIPVQLSLMKQKQHCAEEWAKSPTEKVLLQAAESWCELSFSQDCIKLSMSVYSACKR